MTRLVLRLLGRKLRATGDVLLRAELDLSVRTNKGTWESVTFRVDPGSEMTTMPAYEAGQRGLPMPQKAAAGTTHQPTGLAIRPGFLRARVVGMDQTEYVFPCYFLGDPNAPPNPNQPPATLPRSLLGLSSVIDKFRLLFDGDAAPGAPYGTLVVEKK